MNRNPRPAVLDFALVPSSILAAAGEGSFVETETTYQIFRKVGDNTAVLIETVKGIEEAQKRVKELNGTGPDQYSILDSVAAKVIEPSEPTVTKDPFEP
jgi:hypothetical protein